MRSVLSVGDLVCTKIADEWITGRVSGIKPVEIEVSLYSREGICVKQFLRQQLTKLSSMESPRKAITVKPSADIMAKDVDLFSHDTGCGMHLVEALCGLKTPRLFLCHV